MDRITTIKIKYPDNTYSNQIPIQALAENIYWNDELTLVDVLGNVDYSSGNLQQQVRENTANLLGLGTNVSNLGGDLSDLSIDTSNNFTRVDENIANINSSLSTLSDDLAAEIAARGVLEERMDTFEPLEDGFSPIANVVQTGTGVQINITDKIGTTTAVVQNGTATNEQVAAWMNEHPEATILVQGEAVGVDLNENTGIGTIKQTANEPYELKDTTYSMSYNKTNGKLSLKSSEGDTQTVSLPKDDYYGEHYKVYVNRTVSVSGDGLSSTSPFRTLDQALALTNQGVRDLRIVFLSSGEYKWLHQRMINTSIHFILPDDTDPAALTGDVTIKFDYAVDEDFKWYGGHIKINGSSTNSHKIIFTNTHTNRGFSFEDVSFYSQGCQFKQKIWFSNSYVNCDGSTFYTFEGVGTTGVLQNITITNNETGKKAISLGWGSYVTLRGSLTLKALSSLPATNDTNSAILWISFSTLVLMAPDVAYNPKNTSKKYRAGLRLRNAQVRGYDNIFEAYQNACLNQTIKVVGPNVLNIVPAGGSNKNEPIVNGAGNLSNIHFEKSTDNG